MASCTPSNAVAKGKSETRPGGAQDGSRSVTPTAAKSPLMGGNAVALGAMVKNSQMAASYKSDLMKLKSLATCSICDQLLYEPWTIACGHTYCYTCLLTWFTQNHQNRENRRIKTCPECRYVVKANPAQNFLVKQMVQVIINAPGLTPADESMDQHKIRMQEEATAVDNDRGSRAGIFKGYFSSQKRDLVYDEADDVMRCPCCHHEYEGGPTCQYCGVEVDDDRSEFSDDGEVYSPGSIYADSEVEIAPEHVHHFHGHHRFGFSPGLTHMFHMHHHHPHQPLQHAESELSELANTDGSEGESDEDNSLQDFVVPEDDEEPIRVAGRNRRSAPIPIEISDDESDEGGAISNGRPRPRAYVRPRGQLVFDLRSPSPPLALAPSTNGSEAGESEAARLEYAGWSPLDPDSEAEDTEDEEIRELGMNGRRLPSRRHLGILSESEDEDDEQEHLAPRRFHGYSSISEDPNTSDDGSDTNTETMVGHGGSDDDDRSRTSLSATPTYVPNVHHPDFQAFQYGEEYSDADDDDSEVGGMDHEGDTDMSMSPRATRPSRSVSIDYNPYQFPYRGSSVASTNYDGEHTPMQFRSPLPGPPFSPAPCFSSPSQSREEEEGRPAANNPRSPVYRPHSPVYAPTSPAYAPNSPSEETWVPRAPRAPSPNHDRKRPGTNEFGSPRYSPTSPSPDRENAGFAGFAQHSLGRPSVSMNENLACSSDSSSIRPTSRRRQPEARRYTREGIEISEDSPHQDRFDDRISQMFADFNRGMSPEAPAPSLAELRRELSPEVRASTSRRTWADHSNLDREAHSYRIEPASNSHRQRRMTAYRAMPARRIDPLRSSRSPSATRVISSSNRSVRPARQYIDRLYH